MPKRKIWTSDRIQSGFAGFHALHGRYPNFDEIDAYPGLPSRRTFQRFYDGLEGIERHFGVLITDRRKGDFRSGVSKHIAVRGHQQERALERLLVAHFGEHFVHSQKPLLNLRKRCDFHVYASDYQFDVDVFYPETYRSFEGCLRIKMRTLINLVHDYYLVVANPDFKRSDIDRYIAHRSLAFDRRISIVTLSEFLVIISRLPPLQLLNDVSRNIS